MPGTVRTSRSPPCQPGTVPIATTAATRPLSLCRRRRLHSTHALKLPRVTRLAHLAMTFTLGDAAACSRMPTVISLTSHTHAVFLVLGRSRTRAVSLTHTPYHSHTRGHSPAVFHSHMSFLPCTGSIPHPVSHPYMGWLAHAGSHSHTGFLLHTGSLSHTPLHSRYACVAARISPRSCTHTSTPHTRGPHS